MGEYLYECRFGHGRFTIAKPMAEAGREEYCPVCADPYAVPLRRLYTAQGTIVRPPGHRLKPGETTSIPGLAFDDFRYELERGLIRDDPTPVTLSQAEIDAYDNPPIRIPPDPARDRALAQLVAQHWTEDLSEDTVRRREHQAQHHREQERSAHGPGHP